MTSAFAYDRDDDGIVTISMDMEGNANTIDTAFTGFLRDTIDRIAGDAAAVGVIITSAKPTFCVGGDLNRIAKFQPGDEEIIFAEINELKAELRRLERLPLPVIAAINGAAAGGGLELALACNHRIAIDDDKPTIGLPEVTLGLLPGAGGVVRMTSLLGVERAATHLLKGDLISPRKALEAGLIDAIALHPDALLEQAKAWLLDHANDPASAAQPWDRPNYRPSGDANAIDELRHAILRATRGRLPAPERILDIMAELMRQPLFDEALLYESSVFANLVTRFETRNLIATQYYAMNLVRRGAARPKGIDKATVSKLGIIGATGMSEAIAGAARQVGIAVFQARSTPETFAATDLTGCDIIVDALADTDPRKGHVARQYRAAHSPSGLWAVCVDATSLADVGLGASTDMFGLHIRTDVATPIAEIAATNATSDETLAHAYDFIRQIGKMPIVVNDAAGFYIARTLAAQRDETNRLLCDGVAPSRILQLARGLGFAESLLPGTFDGDADPAPLSGNELDEEDIESRLLFRPAIETLSCLAEGILRTQAEADVAAILSLGAPRQTGGYAQFVKSYGEERFAARCKVLSDRYGERFFF